MLWPRSGRLLLGGLVVSVLVVAACSAKHDPAPGELLLAIDANLNVPDDIDEIGISVIASDGTVASLDHIYAMAPVGAAEFPATLAIVRGTSNPIDIKVAGFKAGSAIILREVVTTIPADRTAILRVDLNWLDEGSTSGAATTVQSLTTVPACDSGQTSIEGTCQSFMLDSASLATFSEGAIVSSTSNACTDMDQCFVGTADQPIAGSITVPQPTLQMVTAPDGGVSASCSIAVQDSTGRFNIGMVPKSNAAGWCNETTCVLPLASPTPGGWTPIDGQVQLPLSICTDSRIASLVIVPMTGSCPPYDEDHPACQDYGSDAGTSADAGTPFDAGTFDAGTFDAQVPSLISFNCESNTGYVSTIGLAVDVESGESYAFVDGGAAFLPGTLATSDAGPPSYSPIATNFDPGATSFAASGDLVAVGSMSGVQVLSAGSGLDAGWYASSTSAPISVAFQPQAGSAAHLVAAGLDGLLVSIEADGGVNFDQWATTPTLLAYDDTMGRFLVASTNNSEWYLSSVTIGSGGRPPAPTPFASEGQGIQAITFSDPDTGVWVDQQNQFYAAAITTADGGAGTALNVQTGLLAGAPSLAGSGGRLAWIGTNGHVYTMNVVNGVALSAPLDLSTRATPSSVGVGFTNASQVVIAHGFLVWVQAGGNVCATPLAALPY